MAFPHAPGPETVSGRVVLSGRIAHIRDVSADPDYFQTGRRLRIGSLLGVPLLREGSVIGVIVLARHETGGFDDTQVALIQSFAEQAVIAIGSATTYRALQERTAALAERNIAFSEQIAHQSATIDVLKAMSASPGDAQPVFDRIVHRAAEVCNAPNAVLFRYDGELLHWQATSGAEAFASPEAFEALRRRFPMAPSHHSSIGRSILSRQIHHVRDIDTDPDLYQELRDIGMKSLVGVPLLRDGVPLGVIGLSAREAGGFSESQIALLETFAEQAVIAIGSAETYHELQARTTALALRNSEYGERIEHQAATIDVLKAMSGSPDATQKVFDLITRRARELCNGALVGLFEFDGELVHVRSSSGIIEALALNSQYPMRLTRETISNRAMLEKRAIHIRDVDGDAESSQAIRDSGSKSILSIPLMPDGAAVGAIALNGTEIGGFSDGQVELLKTFAEQAVIAIGSAETYRDLQQRTEALTRSVEELRAAEAELLAANAALDTRNSQYGEQIQHQSATIDVLKVMSASPGDPRPVFDLIVRRAQDLCDGMSAALLEYDGSQMHLSAWFGGDSAAASRFEAMFPMAPVRESLAGRAILDSRIVHIRDMSAEPGIFQAVRELGAKTSISLPLLRDGVPIGAISMNSQEPGGFSDSQIELLKTFAEQAVIAIGSAETYRELQERTAALAERNIAFSEQVEHQSATIDVLKAMSASPGNAQPVFDLIVHRAAEVCNAPNAVLFRYDGELLHWQATSGTQTYASPEAFDAIKRRFPMAPSPTSLVGRTVLGRQIMHVRDIDVEPELYQALHDLNTKSLLSVPLMRDDTVLGVLGISAREAGGFYDTQVALLQTFAEQAAIAISSAETYRELQERTAALAQRNSEFGERIEQQAATIDVLKVMSASPDDTQPVFDLITRRAQELCNCMGAAVHEFDGGLVRIGSICTGDWQDDFSKYQNAFPMVPTRGSIPCRAILDRQIVHIPDLDIEPDLLPVLRETDLKSVLAIPLLRDDVAIGAFSINSAERGGFTDSQVALLQTFAEQAVIAISSAETYRELRARTAALAQRNSEFGERIEQQSATIDVLKAMSASPDDTQPVFDLITRRAQELCNSLAAGIFEFDGELVHFSAMCGGGWQADFARVPRGVSDGADPWIHPMSRHSGSADRSHSRSRRRAGPAAGGAGARREVCVGDPAVAG